jgi:hypothetical protein
VASSADVIEVPIGTSDGLKVAVELLVAITPLRILNFGSATRNDAPAICVTVSLKELLSLDKL